MIDYYWSKFHDNDIGNGNGDSNAIVMVIVVIMVMVMVKSSNKCNRSWLYWGYNVHIAAI